MSSFIDSGAGLDRIIYMVHFSRSIEQQKTFYNCKASDLGECSYNERTDACLQIACMVKQLNYVWLTAGITE